MTEIVEWIKAHPGTEVSFQSYVRDCYSEDCLVVTMYYRSLFKCRKWLTELDEAFITTILDQMYDEIISEEEEK